MQRIVRESLLIIGIFILLAQPSRLLAQETTIVDLVATNSTSDLLLYFTVKDSFTEKITQGIHNGIPATFTFYVELLRMNKGKPDQEIVTHVFSHTMSYDNLKEEYRIVLNEKNQESATPSLSSAQKLMTEVNGFQVLPLARLDPETPYQLRVKAKLAKKTLPLYFHYLIPFSSLWDFETEWHTLNFRY